MPKIAAYLFMVMLLLTQNMPAVARTTLSEAEKPVQVHPERKSASGDVYLPMIINPQFVASNNYHLLSGSPAKAAGIYIGSVNQDRDGNNRSTPPSIGVYE